jgi:hypothetical protein
MQRDRLGWTRTRDLVVQPLYLHQISQFGQLLALDNGQYGAGRGTVHYAFDP